VRYAVGSLQPMLALFLFLAFGLLFGYFATLNTAVASVSFGIRIFEQIPMYVIILLSLGVGVVVSSLFYIFKSLGDTVTLGKKDKEIEDLQKQLAELMKKAHRLELENTRLRTKTGEELEDDDSL
jgi:uncharacterized membrane protein (DUF106 family)